MDRNTFSALLTQCRENKNIGKNEMCRLTGFTFQQLQRIEGALNNFNLQLVFRYINVVGAVLSFEKDGVQYVISNYEEYPKWLKSARTGLYSLRKLEDAVECSHPAIANVEQGKVTVSIDSFLKIADVLGYSVKIEQK